MQNPKAFSTAAALYCRPVLFVFLLDPLVHRGCDYGKFSLPALGRSEGSWSTFWLVFLLSRMSKCPGTQTNAKLFTNPAFCQQFPNAGHYRCRFRLPKCDILAQRQCGALALGAAMILGSSATFFLGSIRKPRRRVCSWSWYSPPY